MLTEISTAKVKVNKIAGLRPVLEVNWLAARAEALVSYGLELEAAL